MVYHWNCLDETVLVAWAKTFADRVKHSHRLKSCEVSSVISSGPLKNILTMSKQPPKYSTFIDNENYDSEGTPLYHHQTEKKKKRFTYTQPPVPSPSATLPPPSSEADLSERPDMRHDRKMTSQMKLFKHSLFKNLLQFRLFIGENRDGFHTTQLYLWRT